MTGEEILTQLYDRTLVGDKPAVLEDIGKNLVDWTAWASRHS
jgi:hypothetical protein